MKKKIIALFLCVLMLLSVAPVTTMAAELGVFAFCWGDPLVL